MRKPLELAPAAPFLRASKEPTLPTMIPGMLGVKVLHFHFLKTEAPIVEYLSPRGTWDSAQVPAFHFGPDGKVLGRRESSKAVPLSDPVAQTALVEQMAIAAASALNGGRNFLDRLFATMVLVTSDYPDNKDGVGILVVNHHLVLGPIHKYGHGIDRPLMAWTRPNARDPWDR